MSEGGTRLAYAVGGALIGGALYLAYDALASRAYDEDRPPIIVRGGSIIFENQLLAGENVSRDWVDAESGQAWKPNQPNGIRATKLKVSVLRPASGQCTGLEGPTAQIRRASGSPLIVTVTNSEPVVRPKNELRVDNGLALKTLTDGTGTFTSVQVQGQVCQLNADSQIWIWAVK